jgi:hypothetical protein
LYVDEIITLCQKLFFSDDFIQAQQQLARWASEDVVSVVVMESDSSAVVPSPITVPMQNIPLHSINNNNNIISNNTMSMGPHMNGLGATVCRNDYYPSPPSTTETESSGSVMVTQRRGIDANGGPQEITGTRYPEYKH